MPAIDKDVITLQYTTAHYIALSTIIIWECQTVLVTDRVVASPKAAQGHQTWAGKGHEDPSAERRLCWNSTAGFHCGLIFDNGMWFSIDQPNFIWIRWSATGVVTVIYSYRFPKMKTQTKTFYWDTTTCGF